MAKAATPGSAALTRNRWRIGLLVLVLVALAASFLGGAYAGRWAVKNQASARVRAALEDLFKVKLDKFADADAEWKSRPTPLLRLQSSVIHLPHSEGWGGGLHALRGGRIFYATRAGEFGVVDTDGIARVQPFTIDLNLPAIQRHPVYKLDNFNPMWFRVTDIDLAELGGGRHELLVGHHYFDAENQCVQLRLSRAELLEQGKSWSVSKPFETVFIATPCITFYHPGYEFAFEGHFSGGRIARLPHGEVLFSTGDHGWRGLRGYPPVSSDDTSTLGKILSIDVASKAVQIYAKGVRNPQGLHLDSKGRLWETEHGPRGGDELNLIVRGQDYGWPFSTYGTDYGPRPWPHSATQGEYGAGVRPQYSWAPSIGVSSLIEVRGEEFALWKGDLLVLSLTGQAIRRLRTEGDRVVYDEPIPFEGMRLRDIVELDDGRIAVLNAAGQIVQLRNADRAGAAPFLDATKQQPRTVDMSLAERNHAVAGRYASAAKPSAETTAHVAADPAGREVFKAYCSGCHSLSETRTGIGPTLSGIVGRQAGTIDFAYSEALARRGDTWTSRRIVDFAVDPSAMYPGTTMAPVRLSQEQRAELERFFATAKR